MNYGALVKARIAEELLEKVKQEAERQDCNVSEIVRLALLDYIASREDKMLGRWYQLYVKANNYESNRPEAMKWVDDTLTSRFPAAFVAPDGLPVPSEDGNYEVRVFQESALSLVKRVLTEHHRLEIVREVENK